MNLPSKIHNVFIFICLICFSILIKQTSNRLFRRIKEVVMHKTSAKPLNWCLMKEINSIDPLDLNRFASFIVAFIPASNSSFFKSGRDIAFANTLDGQLFSFFKAHHFTFKI